MKQNQQSGFTQHQLFKYFTPNKSGAGFTLIEILVVIGIIAILAAVVLIAINPARQFAQGRDSQRQSNLNTILNAIGQKIADNKGLYTDCLTLITGATTTIDMAGGGAGIDLSCLAPTYVPALPTDPSGVASPSTGYRVVITGSGRVRVIAETQEPNIPRTSPMMITR